MSGKWERAFYGCPGAWYGNGPEGEKPGNITVDVAAVPCAVKYLLRRFRIIDSVLSLDPNPGVQFRIAWRAGR